MISSFPMIIRTLKVENNRNQINKSKKKDEKKRKARRDGEKRKEGGRKQGRKEGRKTRLLEKI